MIEMPYGARASMEPAGLLLRYRDEGGNARELACDVFTSCEDPAFMVEATFDGEVLSLAATPRQPVTVEFVQVALRHAFATGEMVLLNGYQSWTDTVERPAWSRMRGLRGVPDAIVSRWALDGGGDYAIVDYPAKRGRQHGFTYATFRRGEGMVLVGSLDEDRGFTLIRTNAARGEVLLQPECPMRQLVAGRRCMLGRFAITRGMRERCYDRWFELSGVHARPAKPLVGYTSWYRHYDNIDEAKILSDLAGIRNSPALDVSGDGIATVQEVDERCTRLFQIDDGYCKVGDWLQVDAAKFPRGLAPIAAEVRGHGLLPGLWLAPFVCERDSRLFSDHPDWLLRDADGRPVRTGCQWSDGYALDTLNVDVRSYVLDVLRTVTGEWGFGLLKIDFLYAACMMCHGGFNCGELMSDAMQLLRTGVGEDVLLLGCGVPLASAFGRVEFCRIGCDVGLNWDDKPYMRLLHRERVSTKNSLANTRGRAPLDGRAFGNDPDVFFLRRDVQLKRAQRDKLLFTDAELGSVFLTSDDMEQWTPAMRGRYRAALEVFLERH